jgi:hypothetical protein
MDYGKLIRFPMKDKDWLVKIIVGGILSIIPIVNFISFGYEFKVMKNSINLKPGMPEWKGFTDLFVKGIIVFVIALLYMIIPLIIFGAIAGFSTLSYAMGGFANPYSVILTILPALFIGGILILIVGFILPMAIAMYAKSDNFGDSFKFGEILNRIKSIFGEYLVSYIIIVILGFILGLLMLIPFIGWLIGLFGTFYLGVLSFNMFGELYTKSKAK